LFLLWKQLFFFLLMSFRLLCCQPSCRTISTSWSHLMLLQCWTQMHVRQLTYFLTDTRKNVKSWGRVYSHNSTECTHYEGLHKRLVRRTSGFAMGRTRWKVQTMAWASATAVLPYYGNTGNYYQFRFLINPHIETIGNPLCVWKDLLQCGLAYLFITIPVLIWYLYNY
jgi:hypothetical protein